MTADAAVFSALEAALDETAPLTEDEVNKAQRLISRRAWEASREHNLLCQRLGEAQAEAEEVYWTTLDESHAFHPDRRVPHHEAIAKRAALEKAAKANAMELMERSLRKEMEVLEKLISALQTQAKRYRELGP
jgi:hypothetical protein